LGENERNADH